MVLYDVKNHSYSKRNVPNFFKDTMTPVKRHEPRTIIIGAGVAGIALAANLKSKLKYNNFTIYEREKSIGGTWFLNTYPGVGCDVDSHLYSFSFSPNPNWSRRFAEQPEILQYLKDTANKFKIPPHVRTQIEVSEARWIEKLSVWHVTLHDLATGDTFVKEAEILISCVGSISNPKDCDIPNLEVFKGKVFHSARWDHNFDLVGKRVAVVGNGCSAAQLVPPIVKEASSVVQFQRSKQWINERPNRAFTSAEKWAFAWIPGWQKLYRFWIWKQTDALHHLYSSAAKASINARAEQTRVATTYMKQLAPEKYWSTLIPDYPLGCKRRIFDPGYLESLHSPKLELTTAKIMRFSEKGLCTKDREFEVDAVVLATGFKVQEFLSPIHVVGRGATTLNQHWKSTRGAQAYKATFVSGFPNFGIVFGPNAFPAHNSVIYTNETQVEYLLKSVFQPILRGNFQVIEVKEAAESYDSLSLQDDLKSMVWAGGCTNWNLDTNGRNTTNYPHETWKFWYSLYWPVWDDFDLSGGEGKTPTHPVVKAGMSAAAVISVGVALWNMDAIRLLL